MNLDLHLRLLGKKTKVQFPAEFAVGYTNKDEFADINDSILLYNRLREVTDKRMYENKLMMKSKPLPKKGIIASLLSNLFSK